MDTLFWTAFNPDIRLLETRRPMHGKCLYRFTVSVHGSAVLRDRDHSLNELIDARNHRSRYYNSGGSWRNPRPIAPSDYTLLNIMRNARETLSDQIVVRIEEPNVSFYCADQGPLKDLALALQFNDNSHFTSWTAPADDESLKLLQDGKVIKLRPTKYKYKIVFRDGSYSDQTREGLIKWIEHQDSTEVGVPNNLTRSLSSNHRFIWGGYIYVNDPRHATILSMIDPRLVAKLEEFYYASSKE
jgi:hypothetical protein